jgi:hypothetical protein
MKSYSLLVKLVVCCCGFGLMHSPSYGQGRTLTKTQLDAVVKASLDDCSPPATTLKSGRTDPAAIIPTSNAKAFPKDRISKTLNGVWQGRVLGDDGHVGVDYFWIIDMKRSEGLIIAQRSGKETVPAPQPAVAANAPKFTYVMCAHEGYIPSKDSPQVHEFTKVSDDISNAARIVQEATGIATKKARATLADIWRALVNARYFTDPRYADRHGNAYAGGFFKPMDISPVASAIGPSQLSMRWDAEYRGGGATSMKFTPEVPVSGVEYAQFVGTSADSGDFLVASPGNGRLWKVEARTGGSYDLAFDRVILGPLQR